MKVTGVMLAGGVSSRMGTDKAFVEVGGLHMADAVAASLQAVCDEAVAAGREEGLAGLPGIPDPDTSNRGPLAGLVAGLEAAGSGVVVLTAIDQPWVRPETLRHLIELFDDLPLVPVVEGSRQITCAVYPTSIAEPAREELTAGGSIQTLLDRVAFQPVLESVWASWGEDGRSWFSVDTPDALEEGLKRFGPPQPPM